MVGHQFVTNRHLNYDGGPCTSNLVEYLTKVLSKNKRLYKNKELLRVGKEKRGLKLAGALGMSLRCSEHGCGRAGRRRKGRDGRGVKQVGAVFVAAAEAQGRNEAVHGGAGRRVGSSAAT